MFTDDRAWAQGGMVNKSGEPIVWRAAAYPWRCRIAKPLFRKTRPIKAPDRNPVHIVPSQSHCLPMNACPYSQIFVADRMSSNCIERDWIGTSQYQSDIADNG